MAAVKRGDRNMIDKTVRPLREDEIDGAALMLARAFTTDPFPALLADEPAARLAASRWAFTVFVRYGLAFGEVWTIGDLDGVAIWWAPEYVEPTDERAALVGLADGPDVLGKEAWERFSYFGELTHDVHQRSVTGPHWFLNVIGVAPEMQRRGLGGALLTTVCNRLDGEGLPAYLDTATPENVAFYERHGFVVAAELLEPKSGTLIRGMRRDPR
jgi:ribosomal protein S18 acetylase RimI-like enzyme